MGKKCIPGVICIENMTLFVMIVGGIIIIYYFHLYLKLNGYNYNYDVHKSKIQVVNHSNYSNSSQFDPLSNPYAPPLKTPANDFRLQTPINIRTQSNQPNYTQIGILTRKNGDTDLILPLMGTTLNTSRNKWIYYTISNTGNVNTKLPLRINGKSSMNEYGCDEINNNDVIYVEGYKSNFQATIYENGLYSYIPM